ncbi:unnamed protein product, partial [Musa acuminata subsp. burmannicoides]
MGRFQKYYPFSAPLLPFHSTHTTITAAVVFHPQLSPSLCLRFLQLLTLQVERGYVGFASFPLPLLWRILLRVASGSRTMRLTRYQVARSVPSCTGGVI